MPELESNDLPDADLAALSSQRSNTRETERAVQMFGVLYQRHSGALLMFVVGRSRSSDCDDAVQSVWLKAWQNVNAFRTGSFRAWLFGIARNHLIDEARRKKSVPLAEGASVVHGEHMDPAASLLDEERRQSFSECLEQLTQRERSVVIAIVAGTDYSEVSAQLKIDKNAAYKTMHYARAKLSACMQRKVG